MFYNNTKTKKKGKLNNNKHIRFDDNDDTTSDSSDEEEEEDDIRSSTESNIFNLTLIKKLNKTTFGFQVRGDSNENGQHYVDFIENDSAAQHAGLKNQDKILKINGINVQHLNTKLLIDKLEKETKINNIRLNLTVTRLLPNQKNVTSTKSTPAFTYLNQNYTNLKKRIRCKY